MEIGRRKGWNKEEMREKRLDAIEQYIFEKKNASLDLLCQEFQVSKNTIRRDLEELSRREAGEMLRALTGLGNGYMLSKIPPRPVLCGGGGGRGDRRCGTSRMRPNQSQRKTPPADRM